MCFGGVPPLAAAVLLLHLSLSVTLSAAATKAATGQKFTEGEILDIVPVECTLLCTVVPTIDLHHKNVNLKFY